jgi:hypothetical protein
MIMCQQRTKALSLAFMCRGDTTVTWDAHYHCSPQLVNFLSNCYGIDMSQLAKAMEVFALTQQDGKPRQIPQHQN